MVWWSCGGVVSGPCGVVGLMMWWPLSVLSLISVMSVLFSLIIITFIFICYSLCLQFCLWGLSVLRVLCCGGLMWWSYLCGGVVVGLTDNRSQ